MKAIQPVNIWVNGEVKQANLLNLYVVNDDLKSTCTFYYALYKETENIQEPADADLDPIITKQHEILAQGNLVMNGDDYEEWGIQDDINDEAYAWAAGKLSLNLQ